MHQDILNDLVGRGRRTVESAGEVVLGATRLTVSSLRFVSPARLPAAVRAVAGARPTPLGAVLGFHGALQPDKAAIVDSRGSTNWGDFDERVNRLAHAISDGMPGGRVAFMLPNRREAIEILAAAAKLGVTPIPINTRFHREEVDRLLRVQSADMVVVDAEHRERVGEFDGRIVECGDEYETMLAESPSGPPTPRKNRAGDLGAAVIIHTSGTTGHPKGAERDFTEGGVVAGLAFFNRIPFRPDDVVVVPAPVFHALGLGGVIVPLALGATIVLQERFDPAACLALVEQNAATGLVVVPVMLRRMCDVAEAGEKKASGRSGLGWIWVSGSALPPAVERRARRVFGPVVRNLYGSTEAGWVSIATPEDSALKPGTVGRPLPGIDVRIVDDGGHVVGPDEVGEIVVRSKAVFSGYTHETESSVGEGGEFRPGDLGWLDADGYLYVADRADDMVVSGGENLYPAEVERVLHDETSILDAAVVGVPDPEYGHVLAAFVIPAGDGRLDPADVTGLCREHLANYKVPKHVWIVDSLPYNPTGKVLRRKLREDALGRLGGDSESE